jgi:hypothetical protein
MVKFLGAVSGFIIGIHLPFWPMGSTAIPRRNRVLVAPLNAFG